jgi:cold shock CspA family protein
LIDKIYENDKVIFEVTEGKRGKAAVNVEVIK